MKHLRIILLALAIAVAGYMTTAAIGAKPPAPPGQTSNPGSPGDDCSHGNSGQECRTDPSTNGADCDDHGNARGNEDHCAPAGSTTTTSTASTTTGSTSTGGTTTRPGSSTSSVPTGTAPEPTTVTTAPQGGGTTGEGTTTAGSAPGGHPAAGPQPRGGSVPPAVFKKRIERALRKQERQPGTGRIDPTPTARGQLPHTGMNLGERALIGILLILLGLGLRLGTRRA
jgi:hypothetical protein